MLYAGEWDYTPQSQGARCPRCNSEWWEQKDLRRYVQVGKEENAAGKICLACNATWPVLQES